MRGCRWEAWLQGRALYILKGPSPVWPAVDLLSSLTQGPGVLPEHPTAGLIGFCFPVRMQAPDMVVFSVTDGG